MWTRRTANLKAAFAEHNIPWPEDATLFWHQTGPKISYGGGMLKISDLNPESHIQFRMSAKEMMRLGWRCILIALRILPSKVDRTVTYGGYRAPAGGEKPALPTTGSGVTTHKP